ncbi:MAG: hypothetical protein AAF716_04000 [Cyanobacteria bacterium P01_D01_bin.1]
MFQRAAPQLERATELDRVYRVLRPEPLLTLEQLDAFYTEEINAVRGGDKMQRLKLGLRRAYDDRIHFKACVMGHRGVGKSTEISRLLTQVSAKFQPVRFSATDVLDPGSFKPLDVLLVMMMEVAKQTARPVSEGGADHRPSDRRLQEIWDWFATEKETRELAQQASLKLEAGAGVSQDSLWEKVLGLFATLKGEIKFASARKKEVIAYRVTRLDTLIELANRLLDECNLLLREATGKQWLFVGEDFDRAGIPSAQIENLFITYANIFQELRSHLIFTLPISLYYSEKAARLPFSGHQSFVLPDTPMFDAAHQHNERGQGAIEKALSTRMDLSLFGSRCLPRLIVASGGNLRNLFSLVNYATDGATIRGGARIEEADADAAIVNLRSDYERRLGQSPYDPQEVAYQDKVDLLVRIYNGEKDAQMTNPTLYSLLNARTVQEFNGQRWFGIHPLVVDILVSQEHLPEGALGGTF